MRNPETDQTWLTKQLAGHTRLVSVNSANGRLNLRCRAQQVGDQISLYYPKEGPYLMDPEAIQGGVRLPNSHWRTCYHRPRLMWRLFNERTKELMVLKGYQGNFVINWLDHLPHLFHDGFIVVDPDGIAHLFDPGL